MEFLNVSRQRAADPSATVRTLSKAAGSELGTQQWWLS